jgi:hypothetical protein
LPKSKGSDDPDPKPIVPAGKAAAKGAPDEQFRQFGMLEIQENQCRIYGILSF